VQIDAVEQRAGDLRLIVLRAFRRAAAAECGVIEMPATAWVHRRYQLHPRGIRHMRVDPRHRGAAAFQRLAQRFQGGALEFRYYGADAPRNSEMGERHLAGGAAQVAAHQRRQRG
jgi:hypothetical protein